MGKKKYEKGIRSLEKEIEFHENIKLRKAKEEGKVKLIRYYEGEIKRMDNRVEEKQFKLLPRSERIKIKKKLAKKKE